MSKLLRERSRPLRDYLIRFGQARRKKAWIQEHWRQVRKGEYNDNDMNVVVVVFIQRHECRQNR